MAVLPSIKRTTRDLTRLDPRSDGNFSFAGRNWLYNNVSLDGSYFNNPFGLDDPAPGGQTNAEPVPYDAVEQVQVSLAPFDVREGGFTGREHQHGDQERHQHACGARSTASGATRRCWVTRSAARTVVANPDLSFIQSGFSLSGPIMRDKLFFFVNAELERTDDPGTNFVASTGRARPGFGSLAGAMRTRWTRSGSRMIDVYGYDTGPYQGYINETDNDKVIAKLDWNINPNNSAELPVQLSGCQPGPPGRTRSCSASPTPAGDRTRAACRSRIGLRDQQQSQFLRAGAQQPVQLRSPTGSSRATTDSAITERRSASTFPPSRSARAASPTPPWATSRSRSTTSWTRTSCSSPTTSPVQGPPLAHASAAISRRFGFFNSFNIFRHGCLLPASSAILAGRHLRSLDEFFAATDPSSPTSSRTSIRTDRDAALTRVRTSTSASSACTPRTSCWPPSGST